MEKEQNKTLNKIEKSQLESETNAIDERAMGSDMKPSEFTGGTDFTADRNMHGDTEFPKFAETERFAKEVDIDEKSLRQNKGMKVKA